MFASQVQLVVIVVVCGVLFPKLPDFKIFVCGSFLKLMVLLFISVVLQPG